MRLFDYETKKVIEMDNESEANELIEQGKAIKLDLPELEQFESKAREIHANYKKKVEEVKTSEHPLMQDEKVRKYELDRLEKEYRKQSQEIEEAYQAYRKQALEEAKVRAAQASVKLTSKDKQTAEQFATRASLELAGAYDDEKGEAVARIIDDIRLLTDEQRTALQAHAGELLTNVDDATDKRKLIQAMKEVRNPDLLAVEVAKQLPHTVLTMQNISDIAKKVARNEMHGMGGVTREFYEEHLKD